MLPLLRALGRAGAAADTTRGAAAAGPPAGEGRPGAGARDGIGASASADAAARHTAASIADADAAAAASHAVTSPAARRAFDRLRRRIWRTGEGEGDAAAHEPAGMFAFVGGAGCGGGGGAGGVGGDVVGGIGAAAGGVGGVSGGGGGTGSIGAAADGAGGAGEGGILTCIDPAAVRWQLEVAYAAGGGADAPGGHCLVRRESLPGGFEMLLGGLGFAPDCSQGVSGCSQRGV